MHRLTPSAQAAKPSELGWIPSAARPTVVVASGCRCMVRPTYSISRCARLWFVCMAHRPMNQRSDCGRARQTGMGGTALCSSKAGAKRRSMSSAERVCQRPTSKARTDRWRHGHLSKARPLRGRADGGLRSHLEQPRRVQPVDRQHAPLHRVMRAQAACTLTAQRLLLRWGTHSRGT